MSDLQSLFQQAMQLNDDLLEKRVTMLSALETVANLDHDANVMKRVIVAKVLTQKTSEGKTKYTNETVRRLEIDKRLETNEHYQKFVRKKEEIELDMKLAKVRYEHHQNKISLIKAFLYSQATRP